MSDPTAAATDGPAQPSTDDGNASAPAAAAGQVSRVAVTDDAAALLRELTEIHGPLMFHQSGGCCDGSSPMCYAVGDFFLSDADVHLGDLEVGLPDPIGVWMARAQFAYWSHTHLTIDVVPGRGAGFSVESPTGRRFIIRSRLFTDQETALLED